MKQTAVEWLQWALVNTILTHEQVMQTIGLFEQAKAMEKEQIMMAVKDSWYMAKGSNFQEPQEEQYYNETFKSE